MNHKMDFVRQSYSDIAQGKQDTILSSSPDQQALNVSVGYSEEEISLVPPAANMGLGCGNPFRIVEVKEGDTLIDLGSGAGFDCFLASHKVGRKGRVIGVDMTAAPQRKTAAAMWNFAWVRSRICPRRTTWPMW